LRNDIDPDRLWEADIKEAKATLEGSIPQLQKLLLEPLRLLTVPGGEVIGVNVIGVSNVQTPPVL